MNGIGMVSTGATYGIYEYVSGETEVRITPK
jgi:hypothetical protein